MAKINRSGSQSRPTSARRSNLASSSESAFEGSSSSVRSSGVESNKSRVTSSTRSDSSMSLFERVKELSANPAVRYVAGGLAVSFFAKLSNTFSTRYPQIANIVKGGLDSLEGKLNEYKNGFSEGNKENSVRSDRNLTAQH